MPKYFTPDSSSFQITSTDLSCFYSSPRISIYETDNTPKYINTSEQLSFLLREYDERSVVYAIVLEFFTMSGGVF